MPQLFNSGWTKSLLQMFPPEVIQIVGIAGVKQTGKLYWPSIPGSTEGRV